MRYKETLKYGNNQKKKKIMFGQWGVGMLEGCCYFYINYHTISRKRQLIFAICLQKRAISEGCENDFLT